MALSEKSIPEPKILTSQLSVSKRILEMVRRRDLLLLLIKKELSVKYKNSVLGFAWSLLNPALMLLVWYFIFQIVLGSGIPDFAIYLMCGLLVWNLFTSSVMGCTSVIIENSQIVKKVSFPRELLVVAKVGQALVFFFLQALVLVVAMAILQYSPDPHALILIVPALVAIVFFALSLGLILSALNVYYRDIQHFIELALFAWFFGAPIVYSYSGTLASKLSGKTATRILSDLGLKWLKLKYIYLLDPVTPPVLSFERAIYGLKLGSFSVGHVSAVPNNSLMWFFGLDLFVIALSCVLFVIALAIFGKMEANFAEEI